MMFKKLATSILALTVCVSFASSAEAFGLKLPNIKVPDVISGNKNPSANQEYKTSKPVSKSQNEFKKSVTVKVIRQRLLKPLANIEVYQVKAHDHLSVNCRDREVCLLDADYKFLGRTNDKGIFVTEPITVPFVLIVSVPGSGVEVQGFGDVFAEEEWKAIAQGGNPKYQRVEFTGVPLP